MKKKIKKQDQWKIDFSNIITKRFYEFKKSEYGTFEDQNDFEEAMDILNENIQYDIDNVKFDAETLLKDDALRNDLFNELEFSSGSLSQDEEDILFNLLESCGYGIIKLQSMADQTRFEELRDKFDLTPYCSTLQLF